MKSQFPPGPADGLWGMRTMARMKADVIGTYAALQREYGDLVSFETGPWRLFVCFHPEQVREVLVTQAKSLRRTPRVMRTFAQWNGNSILIAEGEDWVRQRRLVQPAFQPRRFEQYGRTIVDCTRRLADSWQSSMSSAGFVDIPIDSAMTGLTLEIICRALFDTDVTRETSAIADAVTILSEVAFHEMQSPFDCPTGGQRAFTVVNVGLSKYWMKSCGVSCDNDVLKDVITATCYR